MKKGLFLVLFTLILIVMSACSSSYKKSAYPLKNGIYGFDYATFTNKATNEISEKSVDDILDDKKNFKEWGNLLSFEVIISNDTEYFYTNDNRVFVLNEGLAFEVIEENTLKLHFPHWRGYDFYSYDIVIILVNQIAYRQSTATLFNQR